MLAVFLVAFNLVSTGIGCTFVRIMLFGLCTEIRGHFCLHSGDQIIEPIAMRLVDITCGKVRGEGDDQRVKTTNESAGDAEQVERKD